MKKKIETGLIGGIEKREIKIVKYDPSWVASFETHKKVIERVLDERAILIEHIGSTSVPNLAAKPIVDILVVVKDSSNESVYLKQMEDVGYVLRVREPDWNEHRMFKNARRDVHIHFYSENCEEIKKNMTFRDWLRANASDCRRYERLKYSLAEKGWNDMNKYAQAKSTFIEEITNLSLQNSNEVLKK